MKKVLFLHGLESKPGGTKAKYLESHGYEVIKPHLPKWSWEESIAAAQNEIDAHNPDVIVGSSRGGAVALSVDPKGAKLVLVAPAWTRFIPDTGFEHVDKTTCVIHCPDDDLVEISDSQRLTENTGANLIRAGVSHRMSDEEALEAILDAVRWTMNAAR